MQVVSSTDTKDLICLMTSCHPVMSEEFAYYSM